jgi:hypothetical protein
MKKAITLGLLLFFAANILLAQNTEPALLEINETPASTEEEVMEEDAIFDALEEEEDIIDDAQEAPLTSNADQSPLPEIYYNHPFIRYQHQVNEEGVAEAYPWLSADALRLYFTKENQIYMSNRNSRYEDFGKPARVEIDESGSVISTWLTNNELEMYTCYGRNIKVFHRNSLNEPFMFQHNLDLGGEMEGFISGISFTPDMRTMVVYNSDEGQRLGVFNMTPGGRPELRKIITVPFGEIAVGQLSKDGKWLYLSVDEDPTFSIYKMDMMDVEAAEPVFTRILSLKGLRIGKPTLSYDETYICFNATASNLWQNNEIMVADLNNLSFIQQDSAIFIMDDNAAILKPRNVSYSPVQRDLVPVKMQAAVNMDASSFSLRINRLYPNPTTGLVNVKYELPVNCKVAELFVNDLMGREIMRRKIDPTDHDFQFSLLEMGLSKGTYTLWINTELGNSAVHKVEYH